ncbi:hypothetical protein [Desulfocurvus sp. DL9XJH121]
MDPQNNAPDNGQGGGTSPDNWLETIPEDMTFEVKGDDGEVKTIPLRSHDKLKEFAEQGVGGLAKSFLEAQKLIGQKAGLRALPEDATDEDKAAFDKELRKLVGVPETPEGYDIQIPEGQERDEEMSGWYAGTAHELGLSQAQAQALSDAFNTFVSGRIASTEERNKAAVEAASKALEKAWGADMAANVETAKRGFHAVAQEAGLEAQEAGAFFEVHGNDPLVLRVFQKVGELRREHGLPDDGKGGAAPGAKDKPMDTEEFLKSEVFHGK